MVRSPRSRASAQRRSAAAHGRGGHDAPAVAVYGGPGAAQSTKNAGPDCSEPQPRRRPPPPPSHAAAARRPPPHAAARRLTHASSFGATAQQQPPFATRIRPPRQPAQRRSAAAPGRSGHAVYRWGPEPAQTRSAAAAGRSGHDAPIVAVYGGPGAAQSTKNAGLDCSEPQLRRRPPPPPPPHARQLFRRHGPAAAAVRSAQSTPTAPSSSHRRCVTVQRSFQ